MIELDIWELENKIKSYKLKDTAFHIIRIWINFSSKCAAFRNFSSKYNIRIRVFYLSTEFIPDAFKTQCRRCTEKQKYMFDRVAEDYSAHNPKKWDAVIQKYVIDPSGLNNDKKSKWTKLAKTIFLNNFVNVFMINCINAPIYCLCLSIDSNQQNQPRKCINK